MMIFLLEKEDRIGILVNGGDVVVVIEGYVDDDVMIY